MAEKWKYEIVAHTDGILAVLPYGDIKVEILANPSGTYKVLELAAKCAYETTHYNLRGEPSNPTIKLYPISQNQKLLKQHMEKNY